MVKGMDLHWITKSRLAEDILMDLRISNHLGSLAVLSSPGPRPDDVIISQRHLGATAAIRRHRSQPSKWQSSGLKNEATVQVPKTAVPPMNTRG
ncbi:uncharacterized protein LOC143421385 isoform X3 [Maylandia zebra]|uniref:uncharacterized protein LOC143421385 isoform X3 n=1 Tax=Maylandia zebra TaxID=106582 RepID=UPI00403C60F2